MADKLDLMEERGLLFKMPKERGSRKILYDLTPRGESCAVLVCRMEEESGVSMSEIMSDFLKDSINLVRRDPFLRRLIRSCGCR
jgi:DNA-binding MarR family transcriptional regulator